MITFPFLAGFSLCLAGVAAILALRSWFRVEEGHVAVLTSFGKAISDNHRLKLFEPGLHLKWPWQKSQIVPMMEQCLDLSGEDKGIVAMAEDGTILRLDSKLRFTPSREEIYHYLFTLRHPLEHIKGLFTCLLRNEIANFRSENPPAPTPECDPAHWAEQWSGSYSVIRRERKRLNQQIEDFSQDEIGGRYGVQFNAIDLTDILPPDELAEALNAVIYAQMEADANIAGAEGASQQKILSAEKSVAIERARAEAVETEIHTLGTFLEDLHRKGQLENYLERRRSEVYSDSSVFYVKR